MSRTFSETERRVIAGGGATLFERLETPGRFEPGPFERDVTTLLDEWEATFADEAAFERRLEWLGVSRDDCRRAMRVGRLAADEPIPDWVDRLGVIVGAIQDREFDSRTPETPPDERPAFDRVSAAVANIVRDRLLDTLARADESAGDSRAGDDSASADSSTPADDTSPDDRPVLTRGAIESATEWFRESFHRSFVRLLYVECKSFVAAHDRELATADPDSFSEPPTTYYEAFLSYLADGGLADLCVEYPMFGRLLERQVRGFETHLRELAERVRADRAAVGARFGDGDPGPIVECVPLADDTHARGRAVTRLTFADGTTVVYKPRSVTAGRQFHRVLERLGDHLSGPAFRTPTSLVRDGYGYVAYVETAEPPSEAGVERYYRRAGALLAVTYLLEFVDCQYENLLAAGEHPIVIDAETVCHPYVRTDRRPDRAGSEPLRRGTVLLTALLPHRVASVYDDTPDFNDAIAGLAVSSDPAVVPAVQIPEFTARNTDVMTVRDAPLTIERAANAVTLDGADQPPTDNVDALVAGFEDAHRTIRRLRDEDRLDAVGIPDAFEGLSNRTVYRPTITYASTLRSICSRAALADGGRFGVELESLAAPYADRAVSPPPPWAVYDAERRALGWLDPPRFESHTDGTEIRAHGAGVVTDADRSGLARARERIAAADDADMQRGVEFVRAACGEVPDPSLVERDGEWDGDGGQTTNGEHHAADEPDADRGRTHDRRDRPVARSRVTRPTRETDASAGSDLTDDALVTEAESIFETIRTVGESVGETHQWTTVEPWTAGSGEPLSLLPTDESLYLGRCGIALFAAGLYRVTGDDEYRGFALDTLRPVRTVLADRPAAIAHPGAAETLSHLGGGLGAGSVAYGLAVAGELLEAPSVTADAGRIADRISTAQIESDTSYDVIDGTAGTILGLLGARRRVEHPGLLATARDCGDHLVTESRAVGNGRAWDTFEADRPLTGFAHGAAGIGYALARLGGATGETSYLETARAAIAYESGEYQPAAQNWPDHRQRARDDVRPDQWCHGRSGIGLARIGTARAVSDDRLAADERFAVEDPLGRDVERAIEGFDHSISLMDHLCCGNAGRAMFLLTAERFGAASGGAARSYLSAAIQRKRTTGAYRLHTQSRTIQDPTLFLGLAGIGYAALRVAAPDALPAVLLWE